ncbi:MAG TPA: hypothetical protein VFW73_05245, partial [Lacipirellulaceae bacterium]|nr:hypothetical protein [Lacipirellulaceae bacterium]
RAQAAIGNNTFVIAFRYSNQVASGTADDIVSVEEISGLQPRKVTDEMTREQIEPMLHQRPFAPFEIRMSNGEVHQIRHPENAMLLRSEVIVGYPESDRAVHCTLHQINTMERIQPTTDGAKS